MSATSPTSGRSRARRVRAIRTGSWSRPNRSNKAGLRRGAERPTMTAEPPACRLVPLSFADLAGWDADDHAAALAAFRRGAAVLADHPPKRRALGTDAEALAACLARAGAMPADVDQPTARAFFEREFRPFEVLPDGGAGFFTGYY
ncbi:MAG: MltA domain-containing protein, partial [Bauldia sp.]|nr:MltA domain-containing protein [Bauldia sp.]